MSVIISTSVLIDSIILEDIFLFTSLLRAFAPCFCSVLALLFDCCNMHKYLSSLCL